ncbi:glycosyl transferase [Myroides odoratimimus]|uniref:glycosyltransferase family 32 protein n=1 Tax=Myroides odoratimimus TaxID=76832 RepID=UPI0025758BAD|nr:glycosyltransferase [Myroides odoratimimus]MDM1507652.1 glycosyl transferase [Myroides odoratimimus]
MIPKIIHYCWFGKGEFPDLINKCVESWRKYLPEYELMFWTEDNFDVDRYPFARQALECKKYAFVSDVCRLYVLKQYGGIYLDTDVEILKNLDCFLHHEAFSGFEDNNSVPTGIMASIKDGRWVSDMLEYYENRSFIKSDGEMDMTTNVNVITDIMKIKGLVLNNSFQIIPNYIAFYPSDVFCPKSHLDGKIRKTDNTVAIHHFAGSWLSKTERRNKKIKVFLRSIIGNKNFERIKLLKKKG